MPSALKVLPNKYPFVAKKKKKKQKTNNIIIIIIKNNSLNIKVTNKSIMVHALTPNVSNGTYKNYSYISPTFLIYFIT